MRKQTEPNVNLSMPMHAARWLRDYLQNPLMEEESPRDETMRQGFFKALNQQIPGGHQQQFPRTERHDSSDDDGIPY